MSARDDAIEAMARDAYKRAHGLTPEHHNWNDPRWETAWHFDVSVFMEELLASGKVVLRDQLEQVATYWYYAEEGPEYLWPPSVYTVSGVKTVDVPVFVLRESGEGDKT